MIKSTAKRSRRLDKKLRSGDFIELGFSIQSKSTFIWSDEKFDTFLDLLESKQLDFGGTICEHEISGFIASAHKASVTEEQRQDIINWLEQLDCETQAGDLKDAWN